jgi:hypothetical protein
MSACYENSLLLVKAAHALPLRLLVYSSLQSAEKGGSRQLTVRFAHGVLFCC